MKSFKFAFDALLVSTSSLLFSCSFPYLMPRPLQCLLRVPFLAQVPSLDLLLHPLLTMKFLQGSHDASSQFKGLVNAVLICLQGYRRGWARRQNTLSRFQMMLFLKL